jgi:hypoxanthine phosphoribosyltransferase
MADPPHVLLSAPDIQKRVAELAAEVRRDFPSTIHLVAVLKGAFVLLGDLIRHMPGEVTIDFIAVESYGTGTTTSGEVRLITDLQMGIEGKDVVIVEDIVDSGATLLYLQEILRARNPRTLATLCLLDKPSRRRVDVRVDYVGFTIGDHFVVGYGLDFAGRYRNLPHVAILPGGA